MAGSAIRQVTHGSSCRWWHLWPRRSALSSDGEELAALDGELHLEEIIMFRTRCALRHSRLMRAAGYRALAVRQPPSVIKPCLEY